MNTLGKFRRSIARTVGLRSRKRHNTVNKVMRETNYKKINLESVKCKHLLRDIHLVTDSDLKQRIIKLCDYKTRHGHNRTKRTVSAQYVKTNNNFNNQVQELIAEACYRIVMEYNRLHKIKMAEADLRRRLDDLYGYNRNMTLNQFIKKYNEVFGENISPEKGSKL